MKCKSEVRRAAIARRDALSPQEIRRRSAAACSHLFSLPEMRAAAVVMFFVSFGSEVETGEMIERALEAGKRVAAPRADPETRRLEPGEIQDLERDLAPGAHGILEPKAGRPKVGLEEIDVVVVPAAAWGEDGYRVGYGGGYYDRFLARLGRARRVGLGLEVQVVEAVPHGGSDLPVEVLVTDKGVRRFGRGERDGEEAGERA
jgi:5-formyltetrahydrofolate cyclo-ligase